MSCQDHSSTLSFAGSGTTASILHATAAVRSQDAKERAEALNRLRGDGHAVADSLLAVLQRAIDSMTITRAVTLTGEDLAALSAPLMLAREILAALEHGEANARFEAGIGPVANAK